jgi:cytochrome b561
MNRSKNAQDPLRSQAAVARYSTLMIVLHWSTAALVAVAYLLSEGGPQVRTDPPLLHFAFGLAVLILVVPRLVARALRGAPPPQDVGGKWLTLAAKLSHATLYLLLIAVPITGWYTVSRLGVPVSLFGLTLPPVVAAVAGDGPPGLVGDLHQLGGNLILILAGLHAALALWHHFGRRDNTLRRMSPF